MVVEIKFTEVFFLVDIFCFLLVYVLSGFYVDRLYLEVVRVINFYDFVVYIILFLFVLVGDCKGWLNN